MFESTRHDHTLERNGATRPVAKVSQIQQNRPEVRLAGIARTSPDGEEMDSRDTEEGMPRRRRVKTGQVVQRSRHHTLIAVKQIARIPFAGFGSGRPSPPATGNLL